MEIIWSQHSQKDLNSIKLYLNNYFENDTINKKLNELTIYINSILDFSKYIGKKVLLFDYNKENIRELYHKPYRIIYEISNNTVCIKRIIHSKQNLDTLEENSYIYIY